MAATESRGASAWAYALKPASWPKTAVPCLLGQAAGAAAEGHVSLAGFVLGVAFTACDTAFIVLMNDWGDQEVDAIKRRMFPRAGSPKTIPDGILPPGRVLLGGSIAGSLALGVALVGEVLLGRPGLCGVALAALAVFVAYSFPPFRLNYRGGGELLEALGVGAMLPFVNATFQSGASWGALSVVFAGYVPLALASAVASGLSDESSDRVGGKRTVTTLLGNAAARRIANASVWAAVGGWGVAAGVGAVVGAPWGWVAGSAGAAMVVFLHVPGIARRGGGAVTAAFAAQREYKHALHVAAWRAGTLLSIFLGWYALA